MSRETTPERLIARLSDELAPVRPLAALRRQVLAVAATGALCALGVALWLGLHPFDVLSRGAFSAALAGALALVAGGGVLLALAARIPGREPLAKAAGAGAVVGLAVVAALCLVAAASRGVGSADPLVPCSERSLFLALPIALCVGALALRGAPWRPGITGLAAAVGASAAGGLLIHLSCPSPSLWHWLIAHALAPLLVGTLGGVGLAAFFRRAAASAHE
ncbi:MAG TPA: NrsF family protein [Myxococcota bacterium]|nr:NrsF family protein [Myxococcota bacterium]